LRLWEALPGAPKLRHAERVCEMRGMLKMPNRRRPAAGRGVAVIGDAALALDPIWGTGCGFAMQSAAWLVDETAAALADRQSSPATLDAALRRYRRLHLQRTWGHALHVADFSRVRSDRLVERLLFSAATRDQTLADAVLGYLGREAGVLDLVTPRNMLRALWVNATHAVERHSRLTEQA
jgi:flavin-dependent dehydrogenase